MINREDVEKLDTLLSILQNNSDDTPYQPIVQILSMLLDRIEILEKHLAVVENEKFKGLF